MSSFIGSNDFLSIPSQVNSQAFTEWLRNLMARYEKNISSPGLLELIREARLRLAETFLNLSSQALINIAAQPVVHSHDLMFKSELRYEELTPEETRLIDSVLSSLGSQDIHGRTRHVLILVLYRFADELPEALYEVDVMEWLRPQFLAYLFAWKKFFTSQGELQEFSGYYQRLLRYYARNILEEEGSESIIPGEKRALALQILPLIVLIPLYFEAGDLREVATLRGRLMEAALEDSGVALDYKVTSNRGRRKRLKIGILKADFRPQTETFATIPVFEHLDRDRFEILLFCTQKTGQPLEEYCQGRADEFVLLPEDLKNQARLLREARLDLLFFSTNITAVFNTVCRLAAFRLAPVQVTSICSPVTSGLGNIDYYIAGEYSIDGPAAQQHYTEKLLTLPGSGFCFNFALERPYIQQSLQRSAFGLPDGAVIFVSGANFFKVTPELRNTWAEILAKCPGSLLLLYPFNPYWSRSYLVERFTREMRAVAGRHGVEPNRVVLVNAAPTRAHIKALLSVTDVYLDAYPFCGATSLIDPLQVGVPSIVLAGDLLRFRQGAALLRELGLSELIACDVTQYQELAIRLGGGRELRRKLRAKILEKIENGPPFLESKKYSRNMGDLFERLIEQNRS